MGPSCLSQGKMLLDHHPTFQVVAVYKYMSDYLQGLHDNSRIIPKILFGLPQPWLLGYTLAARILMLKALNSAAWRNGS